MNIRTDDDDFRTQPGERQIAMDRSNPTMGNKHFMKTQSRQERERVIEAYQADLEADVKRKGPMWQTMMAIAFDIVDKRDKIAIACFLILLASHMQ